MDFLVLLAKTVALRPYVFVFLAVFLAVASRLLGWPRTAVFFFGTWATAFVCEFSSTRTGVPFGWYHYTGSTVGEELYLANVPFMDSLSFTFLLFASYCLGLCFVLPRERGPAPHAGWPRLRFDPVLRRSWPVLLLSVLFFAWIDIVIDPVALRGERWFLGRIYWYPEPGVHFGVPIANYAGWAVVGTIGLGLYVWADRRLPSASVPSEAGGEDARATRWILLGAGLYYGVLGFNLAVTFWIGEALIATTGLLIYLPVTVLLALRLLGHLPASGGPAAA